MGTTKPLSDFRKLHAYARNSPNGASDDRLDDWLHTVGSEADEEPGHAEMVADLRDNRVPSTAEGYVCKFAPREVRYIRVTQTHNSANTGRHLVEVSAYEE